MRLCFRCSGEQPFGICTRRARRAFAYNAAMQRILAGFFAAAAVSAAAAFVPAQPSAAFDVLIQNGRVMDGSGNPWLRADVGIRGDRIAAVGRLTGAKATLGP